MKLPAHRSPRASSHIALFAVVCGLSLLGCRDSGEGGAPVPPVSVQEPTTPAQPEDLRAFLYAELQRGNKRVVIPPGRYRVKAERTGHLAFSDLKDVEIIAENVELVCTSTTRAVSFVDCVNVTLRGLKVDYDPLPFSQGKIVAMAPDKSWLDVEIAGGYPEDDLREPLQIYVPDAGVLRRGDANWNEEVTPRGNRRYRMSKSAGYTFDAAEDSEQIGDILVAKNFSGGAGAPHAFELRGCRGVRLEDITLHAAPSFGFLERGCDGTTYLRCIVDRRRPEDDPVKRELPRMRSLNADAFHSKDAVNGPAILSCTARFMGDDAVNINGRFHFVRGASGREVRIAMIDKFASIRPGDPLQFLPFAGPRPPDAKVVDMRLDPEPFSPQEVAFIRRLQMDKDMRSDLLEGRATFHTLTLDREVALAPGSAICCLLGLGHGFAVKGCDFGDNRSRGILIKASRGEVSGNRLTNTRMASVLISPEFWWMEGGMSSNVVVKDNLIKGALQTPVQIHARGGNRRILPAGALKDISVLNNRFVDCVWPLIHVTSTSGLVIDGNIFPAQPSGSSEADPNQKVPPVLLENCQTKR
ncbi:MAG: hypothetical protein ACKO2G_13755 [Verrucomicrobiales bacterium]